MVNGEDMNEYIFGIVPPMVTPFRPDNSIDEQALRAETQYLIDTAKVHGLSVCGSTGERHTLSTAETRHVTAILTATPTLCVSLWDAVRSGDFKTARTLHEKWLPI